MQTLGIETQYHGLGVVTPNPAHNTNYLNVMVHTSNPQHSCTARGHFYKNVAPTASIEYCYFTFSLLFTVLIRYYITNCSELF